MALRVMNSAVGKHPPRLRAARAPGKKPWLFCSALPGIAQPLWEERECRTKAGLSCPTAGWEGAHGGSGRKAVSQYGSWRAGKGAAVRAQRRRVEAWNRLLTGAREGRK